MRRYVSVTDTAKLLREALKAEFPGVKFAVQSRKYSGGASIDVSWLDGPTSKAVEPVLGRYSGATFDGMIDLRTNHTTLLASPDGEVEEVQFGAHYVFGHRSVTPEFQATLELIFFNVYGVEFGGHGVRYGEGGQWHTDLMFQLRSETPGPTHQVARRGDAS